MSLTGTSLGGGRYRIGTMLGQGGMGAVYEAVQQGIERTVALKVVHPHLASDVGIRQRFKREARVVATIHHPNVVQISDYQELPNEPPFLVMELLHGENLRDALRRTPQLPTERVVHIMLQVLSGLDAAHRAGVVHRDMKPDNVFLEQTSAQRDIVKLLDFGISKLLGEEDHAIKLTRQGEAIGTPSFMAPEQALGAAIDGRADVYAVAAMMFLSLTGRKIFEYRELRDLVRAVLEETPPPIISIRPDVPRGVSDIVARALAKNPNDRWSDALAMSQALAPYATGGSVAVDTLASAPSPPHDTIPNAARTAPMVHAPRPAVARWPVRARGSNAPVIVAAIVASIVVGGALVYFRTSRSFEVSAPKSGTTARADPSYIVIDPLPSSTPSVAPLDSSINDPPLAVSAPAMPMPMPTPTPTPRPTVVPTAPPTVPPSMQPPECNAARLMHEQGQTRMAASLAARCVRKGGSSPF